MTKVTLVFKCQEGKGADLLAAFSASLEDTRAFDGCRSVETFVDSDNPDTIILIEDWDTRDQQEKYLAWRIESGMIEMLAPIMAEPLEMRFLDAHPA
jgi:quinol monooxygenase YgiN